MILFLLQSFSYWLSQNTTDWMPRAMCVQDNPIIISLHILSEAMITLAYYSIPLILWYIARKQIYLFREYRSISLLFALFIFLCGTTHLIGIIMFWYPIYWVDGAVKFLTGLVSLFTAISLFMVVPKMLEVAPKEMLDRAISDKVHAELKAELLQANLDVWNEATQAKIDMLRDRYSALRNKK